VTARARRLLDAAGYRQVTAVCADAETGFADGAPYDRILVTVGAWDIPPAWTGQLAAGGRLVVPLRLLGGLTRSVALESAGEHWSSLDHQMCGFVPMRGAGAHDERQVVLHDHVRLCLGDRHLQADVGELAAALVQPGVRRWTGVSVTNNEPFDGLHVWLATTLPGDSPAHQVLLHLAQVTQHRSHTSAVQDLEILDEHVERTSMDNPVVIAARPIPVPDVENDELAESTWRAGWMEILGRTDQLAVECVREVTRWDGGAGFPYSQIERFNPTATPHGAEWAARLEPTVRTAAFELIDSDGRGQALIDPATDAPAVLLPNGEIKTAVPQRLATISPLAELILDDPIWVRVEDGTLYLAPKHHYFGLSWGYGGSGPGSLALLIHRLLDDITAPAADHVNGAAEGLEKLTQRDWPAGTVLTRVQLEAARDGRPYAAD